MAFWSNALPIIGAAAMVSFPLSHNVLRVRAEDRAADFLHQVRSAQQAFRDEGGNRGYASDLATLTTPCPGQTRVHLSQTALNELRNAGYDAVVRAAESSKAVGADCFGRPVVTDFYAAASVTTPAAPPQRAFATTSTGRVFLFFDGVAPTEADMEPGGLATSLDEVEAFKIP